jgi:AcrR family transcriptional regulator
MASSRSSAKHAPDVRDRILDEATRLFAARGFDGASLQEVAEAVGVRRPTVLYHLSSKDALRQAVLERLLAHWNEVLPRLLLAAASGEERFDNVLRELVRFFDDDPDRARLLVREVLDRPAALRAVMARHLPRWIGVVRDYIVRGQESGEVHADLDPEAYVLHVINLVVSAIAVRASMSALLVERNHGRHRDGPAGDRYLAEVLRLARAALFVGRPLPERSELHRHASRRASRR